MTLHSTMFWKCLANLGFTLNVICKRVSAHLGCPSGSLGTKIQHVLQCTAKIHCFIIISLLTLLLYWYSYPIFQVPHPNLHSLKTSWETNSNLLHRRCRLKPEHHLPSPLPLMADDEYDLWDTLHLQPGATLDEVQHRHTVNPAAVLRWSHETMKKPIIYSS